MLEKKYYDGTQVHEIISEEVKDYDMIMKILKRFADEPSAKAEIIRCKDCEYGEQDEIGRWYCRGLGCQMGDDDGNGFCSDAEKREE
jgi:hypothetical protein